MDLGTPVEHTGEVTMADLFASALGCSGWWTGDMGWGHMGWAGGWWMLALGTAMMVGAAALS